MTAGKVIKERFQSYTKPCKRCEKLFNPTSKFNKICDPCKSKSHQWRKTREVKNG